MIAGRNLLLDVLKQATGRRPDWSELLLLRNVAPVPPSIERPGDTPAARGFHVALLDRQGRISHYLKCRAPNDPRAMREGELLERLRGTDAADCVPLAAVTRGEALQVILLHSVPGTRLDERLRRRAGERAPEDAAAVLHSMDRIRAALSPDQAPALFDPSEELEGSLRALATAGLTADSLTLLRSATSGALPRQPQHGDLWPQNIIWGEAGPVLLDFEAFGEIGHPMFDAWHLTRSSYHALAHGERWLDVLSPGTEAESRWHSLLGRRQAAAGIKGESLLPGLSWYIVQMAGTLLQRGVPERFSDPFVEDVRRVAALLA